MRPRYQEGQIELRSGQWWLRVRDAEGSRKREFLALQSEYPQYRPGSKTDMARLRAALSSRIAPILARYNVSVPETAASASRTLALSVAEFIEQSYFPRLDWRLQQPAGNEFHIEPSTVKGYKDIFRQHVQPSALAKTKLIDVTEIEARRFAESLNQNLSHQTHLRIKNFMSGVFTWAREDGVFKSANPFENTKVGGTTKKNFEKMDKRRRKIAESNSHAYTLQEVADMLDKLPEPIRTICAVSAFTGLTKSELRGLKWSDYDGETVSVSRKVWGSYIGAPKTEAREAGVPVISTLRKILANYKQKFPPVGDGWIFYGVKSKKPLSLDNISRRDLPIYLNGTWHGWHAFRRGLGTRLNEFGVDAETIQTILRHGDVSTTQAYYILPDRTKTETAMKRMDAVLKKYGIKA